jgi:hypothetical protein
MKRILFAFIVTTLFLGCSAKETPVSESPSSPQTVAQPAAQGTPAPEVPAPESARVNQPPRLISVDTTPEYPKLGDTIKVSASVNDSEGDKVSLTYEWFRNDVLLNVATDSLYLSDDFRRGDRIMAKITPDDGRNKGNTGLIKTVIANSPPEITSSPDEFRVEKRKFSYQARAKDRENDPVSYSLKTAPSDMTIDSGTGLIQWNIPPAFKGKATIAVQVMDDHGGESLQSFIFDVNP